MLASEASEATRPGTVSELAMPGESVTFVVGFAYV